MSTEAVTALTAFCVNNPELDQLEAMLAEFNIFEAAGLTSQEIRHSRFLSFLLDPKAAHGLGDLFVTRLLQAAVHGRPPDEVGVTALDLELMDLNDLQVACEVQNIDVLLLSPSNRFAVVIENKVGTGEHSNQLPRYLETVLSMKPGWRVLPLLLSPRGFEPSDSRYFAVSYEGVCDILSNILQTRKASMGPDVAIVLSHYERLLRRHVVSDSQLNELCQLIIAKHRKAIELLAEHLGDPKVQAWEITDALLSQTGFVRAEGRWLPENWRDWVPVSQEAPNGYILGFWVDVYGRRLRLMLEIQPGPTEIRTAIFAAAQNSEYLRSRRREMTGQWTRILDFELSATRQAEGDPAAWEEQICERMKHFTSIVLPKIEVQLKQAVSGL